MQHHPLPSPSTRTATILNAHSSALDMECGSLLPLAKRRQAAALHTSLHQAAFCLSLCLSLGMAFMPVQTLAEAAVPTETAPASINFLIPAGPLADTLDRFARQANVSITYDAATLQGRTSAGLSGNYSVTDGLAVLLADTGLSSTREQDVILVQGEPKIAAPATAAQPAPETPIAQPQAPPTQLETVSVTGSRAPKALSDLASSITQVENAEIQEQLLLTTDIRQSLDVLVPGLSIASDTRNNTFTTIRGRTAQLLVNGIPTNDNLRTSNTRGLASISPYAIERIEVVRGGSALYGAGAPGGIINLITRKATSEQLEIDAVVRHGINPGEASGTGESNLYLGAGQSFSGWDYYGGLSLQDFGQRRTPGGDLVVGQEDQSWSLDGSIGRKLGGGELRLTGTYFLQDPGTLYEQDPTPFAGQRFAEIIEVPDSPLEDQAESEVFTLALSYDHPEVFNHRLNTSLYLHDESNIQRAVFLDADGDDADTELDQFLFNSDQDNQRYGFRLALNRAFALDADELSLTYGVDLLRQRFYRPRLDEENASEIVGYVSPEVLLDSYALFAEPQYRHDRWLFTAGARYERFLGEVGNEGFNPALGDAGTPGDIPEFDITLFNLGVIYDLTDDMQIYAGFSQGAEISEFGRAARRITDPSLIQLDGANSNQYELGWRGKAGPVEFNTAVFYSDSDDAASLELDPVCAGEPICPLIPVRLKQEVYGLDGSADWRVNAALKTGLIFTWQRGTTQEPDEAEIELNAGIATPARATVYAEWIPAPKWNTRLQATYTSATHRFSPQEELDELGRDTDSLFLVDATVGYAVGPGRIALGIANLLDKEYINVANDVRGGFFNYRSEGLRATLSYSARF